MSGPCGADFERRKSGIASSRRIVVAPPKPQETHVESGSGNVFADLGLPDADTHLLKAELVFQLDAIVRQRRLTQREAARLLGLSQPDVSRLLRGRFRDYSVERLLKLLTTLDRDVEIVIRRRKPSGGAGAGAVKVRAA
jgi:predicted XRE-type DNA-binding protein